MRKGDVYQNIFDNSKWVINKIDKKKTKIISTRGKTGKTTSYNYFLSTHVKINGGSK